MERKGGWSCQVAVSSRSPSDQRVRDPTVRCALIVNKRLSVSLSLSPATVCPSCVLLKRVPQGRTESGGIVLAANAGPRVPRGGVTLKRRCTHRPSVIYLIVNKLLSLSLLSLSLSLSIFFAAAASSLLFTAAATSSSSLPFFSLLDCQ